MHDVVAHNLAVIGIQAGAGLRVFDRDPEQARAALHTIHHTNRQALAELRATVDLLRGDERLDRSPAPGLSGLDDLLDAARASGVDARLEVSGVRAATDTRKGAASSGCASGSARPAGR